MRKYSLQYINYLTFSKYILQSMKTIRGLFRTQISKKNLSLKRLKGFQQKAPSQMFEKVLNMPLTQKLKGAL